MTWSADPVDQENWQEPDEIDSADEVYSEDEEDEIAARLEALGYLD